MRKLVLTLLVVLVAFTLAACGGDDSGNQPSGQSERFGQSAALVKTELTVWGMTCNSCANKVSKAISALDGVARVSVDLRAELVTVEHEPELDVGAIKDSVTAAGFNIQ